MMSSPLNNAKKTQHTNQTDVVGTQNNDLNATANPTVAKRGGFMGLLDKVANFFSNLFSGIGLSKEEKAARVTQRAETRIAESGTELIKGLSKGKTGTSEVNNILALTRNADKLSPENPDKALREELTKLLDSIPRDQLEQLSDALVDDRSRDRMIDQLEAVAEEIVMLPVNAVNDMYHGGSLKESTPEPNPKQRREIDINNTAIFNVIEELRMLVPQHLSGRPMD